MRQACEHEDWTVYQKPVVERPGLKEVIQTLFGRARDLLPFSQPRSEPFVREEIPRIYQKPVLTKLSCEQASLILLGHGGVGDPGARDLMDLVFRDQRPEVVSARCKQVLEARHLE